MKLRFWGVRGSIPTPGLQTVRYGGNTSCIEVATDDQTIVFDCGTGARNLGMKLLESPPVGRQLDLVFTHLHVDHIFGFPFFGPIFAPSWKLNVFVPTYSPEEARGLLTRFLNGINHPLQLHEIPVQIKFSNVHPRRPLERGGMTVHPVRLNHPGGSLGYRVTNGKRAVVYLTDTAPLARVGEGIYSGKPPPTAEKCVVDAMAGADVVVMDTMFSWEEYLEKMTWGHSYPEYALALARAAGVRHLILFHHSPDASDDELDVLAAKWADHREPRVTLAREGLTVDLEG